MRLVIVGAGNHAKVVIDAVHHQRKYEIVCCIDASRIGQTHCGYPVRDTFDDFTEIYFIVAIGDNKVRKALFEHWLAKGARAATVIHPSAIIAPNVVVKEGSMIMAGTVINVDATIGPNCIVNTGTTIDHDCSIGAHAHIAPGCNLAGTVTIGEGAFLGIGTVAIPCVEICPWATAGAGAVLTRNVLSTDVMVGVPARPMQEPAVRK
jgi:sugar O-acyltransferase (sialic acid O-acetyltransferase NeuD family)